MAEPKQKTKSNKKVAAVLAGVLAISGFVITLYISYVAVIAYLFATRPLHGAGPFPNGIYAIPWITSIIIAALLALAGWVIAPKLVKNNQQSPKTSVVTIILVLIFMVLLAGTVFYCWRKQSDQQNLQGTIDSLQEKSQTSHNEITWPDYVTPEQITWVERGEKDAIYAVARPLATFLRPAHGYSLDSAPTFTGVIKSTDNGKNWQKVYETNNDILDFTIAGSKNLYLVIVSRYGGGSGEMFIKIAVSQDGGNNWSLSNEMAKNDPDKEADRQPFIYGTTGNLVVDPNKNNQSYLLYKDGAGSDSFNKMVTTDNFWQTWQRKDVSQ